jgi:23S rRNA (adenine2503-C2)-methyltransferase
MTRFSIHNQTELKALLAENKIPAFRYGQIENAIYKNFITDFDEIQTIPKDLRELLKENCFYQSLTVEHAATSKNDQTSKFLFRTTDNLLIEAVLMRHLSGRNTLCISCQA